MLAQEHNLMLVPLIPLAGEIRREEVMAICRNYKEIKFGFLCCRVS